MKRSNEDGKPEDKKAKHEMPENEDLKVDNESKPEQIKTGT